MIEVKLPDGTVKEYADGATALDVAQSIGERLANAVVAAEVKSLAEQSKKANFQVRRILSEIQQATNTAVLSTEQGSKAVNKAGEVVGNAGEVINALSEIIAASSRAATQISASARQQAAGVTQLNEGVKNIDKVTKENALAIQQVEQSARTLTALSNELTELVDA